MNVKSLMIGSSVVFLLGACSGSGSTEQQQPPVYETMELVAEDATQELSFPVVIKGQDDVEIRPRVSGFIKDILVDEGSIVKKGQLLFSLDSPETESALRSAEAAVNSAKASVNTAKVDVERIRPLVEKKIVSEVNLLTAENTYQSAKAALAQAEATLLNARASRSWANVTSPVDGVVGTITYRKGNLVSSTSTLTTVADVRKVYANFSLNEKQMYALLNNLPGTTQAEKIKNLPEVKLFLADGSEYAEKGRIETVSGVVDIATGSVNLRVEFPNAEGYLKSGSSGTVVIPRTMKDVYVIPQSATFNRQDKVLLYKVQGDSVVQSIVSVIDLPDGKHYAVVSGAEQGERIVKSGVATLSQGMKITVK